MAINGSRPTCFYHPIKVVFLDDSRAFLDILELELKTQINMLTLTCPNKALQLINKNSQDITNTIIKYKNNVNVDTTSDRIISFEMRNILNLIYDKNRFNIVSILVIDYEMPDINGIEFCKKLQNSKIYKIMLTAEADKDTAITAFNNGLIDKFILKTSKNLYTEILSAIHELTQRYFSELSLNIIHGHGATINTLFNNEIYQKLFAEIEEQAKAVEYYLVDYSGSVLFLDENARPTWFIVRSDKELIEQSDLLEGYELKEKIIESVAKKEKILFLFSENEHKKSKDEWVNYLFESRVLAKDYYYSIIPGHITDSIDWDRVVPYSAYTVETNCKDNNHSFNRYSK